MDNWTLDRIKLAAGYKSVLRDATKAFNRFSGAQLSTMPSPVSKYPRMQKTMLEQAKELPENSVGRKVREYIANKIPVDIGPHAAPFRVKGKPISGIELRARPEILRGVQNSPIGVGRNFTPVGIAGHELGHAHQTHEIQGLAGPTSALEHNKLVSSGTENYNKLTAPGLVRRTIGRMASIVPGNVPIPPVVPGIRSDISTALKYNRIRNPELQADRVGNSFSEYLKNTNPDLHASLTNRIRKESIKYDDRMRRMNLPDIPEAVSNRYADAAKDPELKRQLLTKSTQPNLAQMLGLKSDVEPKVVTLPSRSTQ